MSTGCPKITVYIMSFNEVRQIRAVLASVKWADEIIVVDSFSTDGTVEIAHEFGARVLSEKFCGFGKLRNFALDAAQNDWIVSIDSDERCVPEFVEELRRTLAAPQHAAYYVPRLNTFLGGPVRYGGMYPDYRQPQVFNRRQFRYREDLVHENFDCTGSIGYFKTPIWQHPWPTLAVMMSKMDRYTSLMAQRRFDLGKRHSLSKMIFSPPIGFLRKYVFQQGWRDGLRGFVLAILHVSYTFIKYAKQWELELNRKEK